MSTSRSTDHGDSVEIVTGEPTWQNPVQWLRREIQWRAGTQQANAETIRQQAAAALAGNRTYLGVASPTNAQNTAQIKALTRQMNGLIRLALGQLDGTD